jgi:RNA polymerase-binding transcription factor DksA
MHQSESMRIDPQEVRERLIRRRREVLRRWIDESEDAFTLLEQRPTEEEEQSAEHALADVLQRLGHAERALLQRIDDAGRRLDAATYGVCRRCGQPIAIERLLTLPETPHCSECAAELEQQARRDPW